MTNLRQAMARLPQAPTTLATEATVAASGSLGMRVVDRPTVAAFGTAGSAASASSTAPVREMPPGVELAGARLELSNGSGVAGAAARMREWLGTQGVAAHRLTNHRTFSQQYTTLQYRDGQEGEARRLATVLPVGVPLQRTNQLRTDLRIVIGHDWKPPVDAARISRGANRATHFASAR